MLALACLAFLFLVGQAQAGSLNDRTSILTWEYTLVDEATIQGFRVYRQLGDVCSQYVWNYGPDTLVATVTAKDRGIIDSTLQDSFAGEACYIVTAFGQFPDDTTGLPVEKESFPSNRVAKPFLQKPTWWGETVEIQ